MATESLGTLGIDIKIDWNKVNKSLNQVGKNVNKVSKSMTSRLKSTFGGISRVAFSAARKTIAIFKNAFDQIVRIVRTAMLIIGATITATFALSVKAAMKQEDALFAVIAALKNTGDASKETVKDFTDFASAIQQVTVYGDEEVLALIALQKNLGVSTDKLQEATKITIGLAAATGRNAESMAMYVALALQGETTMLRRYIPALKSATNKTEELAIITAFAANGFKTAEARALTTSGALKQMKNSIGDVTEVMGQPFLRSIANSSEGIKKFAEENNARIAKWAQGVSDKLDVVKKRFKTFITRPENVEKMKRALDTVVGVLKVLGGWLVKVSKRILEFLKSKKAIDIMVSGLRQVKSTFISIGGVIKSVSKTFNAFISNPAKIKSLKEDLISVVDTIRGFGKIVAKITSNFVSLNNFLTKGLEGAEKVASKSVLSFLEVAVTIGVLRGLASVLASKIVSVLTIIEKIIVTASKKIAAMIMHPIAAFQWLLAAIGDVIVILGGPLASASAGTIAVFSTIAAVVGWFAGKIILGLTVALLKVTGAFNFVNNAIDNMITGIIKLIALIPGMSRLLGIQEDINPNQWKADEAVKKRNKKNNATFNFGSPALPPTTSVFRSPSVSSPTARASSTTQSNKDVVRAIEKLGNTIVETEQQRNRNVKTESGESATVSSMATL